MPLDVRSYTLSNLGYDAEYQFKMLACYADGKDTFRSEGISLKTESMDAPRIVKVYKDLSSYHFFEENAELNLISATIFSLK